MNWKTELPKDDDLKLAVVLIQGEENYDLCFYEDYRWNTYTGNSDETPNVVRYMDLPRLNFPSHTQEDKND